MDLELDDYVTAPEKDAAPNTDAIDSSHYTGTVAWTTESGEAHTGNFAAGAIYKAVLALSAKTGYSFIELPANSFTYSGAAVIHDAGSGDSLTVTITFPKTAEEGPIMNLVLDSYVTAPERDAAPNTNAIDSSHYTGTVVWETESGEAQSGNFTAGAIYKAVLALSAKTGYSFIELPANSFTYSGAAVTHDAGSEETLTVTIIFPRIAFISGMKITHINDLADYILGEAGGVTADAPVPINLEIELYHDNWIAVLTAVENAGKFVDLDLSTCYRSSGYTSIFDSSNRGLRTDRIFDPRGGGASKVVSLILPNTAEIIIRSEYTYNAAFVEFTSLRSITGAGIKIINERAFFERVTLTSIDFPVAEIIRQDAFARCTGIDSVNLPALTTIDNQAFAYCTSIAAFSVPASLTGIDGRAFTGCLALRFNTTGSTLYSSLGEGRMLIKNGTTLVLYPSAAGNITLANSITGIDVGVFSGFTNLTGFTAPNVTSIGEQAFNGCTALASINFPAVTIIGNGAFKGCSTLPNANIPTIEEISYEGFLNCTNLASVSISANTIIRDRAFAGCPNLVFTITGSGPLSTLGNGTMLVRNGSILESYPSATGAITLPGDITTIGNGAFYDNDTITSLSSSSVITLGDSALYSCSNLTSVSLPAAQTIGSSAFSYTGNLTTIDLRSAVSIGAGAFSYFCGIDILILGPTPPTLGTNVTQNLNAGTKTIRIPQGSQTDYGVPDLATGVNFNNNDRTSSTWGVGFCGAGWDGENTLGGYTVGQHILFRFELYY